MFPWGMRYAYPPPPSTDRACPTTLVRCDVFVFDFGSISVRAIVGFDFAFLGPNPFEGSKPAFPPKKKAKTSCRAKANQWPAKKKKKG